MNRAERRALKRNSRKGSHPHADGCGCSGTVNIVADLVCPGCGEVYHWDIWMPSNGPVGAYRELGTFCAACDTEISGQGLIVDRVDN